MKRFSDYIKKDLNESLTVYRGIPLAGKDKNRLVTWVSTSKEHAAVYSELLSGKGEVIEYKIAKKLVPLDLGFSYAEVDVDYEEIRGRLNQAILDRYENNQLSDKKAMELIDELRGLKISGMARVHEYMHKPQIIGVIKKAGFNCILQREGMVPRKGNIITYGILDKNLLS